MLNSADRQGWMTKFAPSQGGSEPANLREVALNVRQTVTDDPDLLEAILLGDGETPGLVTEHARWWSWKGWSPEDAAGQILRDLEGVFQADPVEVRRLCYRTWAELRGLGAGLEDDPSAHLRDLRRKLAGQRGKTPIRFGIDGLDRCLQGSHPGELLSLVAPQGSGKTALALNLAEQALADGHRVLFATLDMGTGPLVIRRLLRRTGWAEWRVREALAGDRSPEDLKVLHEAEREIRERDDGRFHLLGPDIQGACTTETLLSAAMRTSPDVVIVDYLTLLRSPKHLTDLSVVQEAVPRILAAADRLGFVAVLLSQMSRSAKVDARSGQTGGHGKGGGLIEERATAEVELMKFGEDYIAQVTKNRRGPCRAYRLEMQLPQIAFSRDAREVQRSKPQTNPFGDLL